MTWAIEQGGDEAIPRKFRSITYSDQDKIFACVRADRLPLCNLNEQRTGGTNFAFTHSLFFMNVL